MFKNTVHIKYVSGLVRYQEFREAGPKPGSLYLPAMHHGSCFQH